MVYSEHRNGLDIDTHEQLYKSRMFISKLTLTNVSLNPNVNLYSKGIFTSKRYNGNIFRPLLKSLI